MGSIGGGEGGRGQAVVLVVGYRRSGAGVLKAGYAGSKDMCCCSTSERKGEEA